MAKKKHAALSVETLWQIERIGGLSLAPGGDQAVCLVGRHSMDDNRGASSLWLLSTRGAAPRRLTSCGDKDAQAAWSPQGDRIAFIARREQQGSADKTAQLYVIAPDGGEARRVTNFGPGIDSFKWLPNGRGIVFAAWAWPELKGEKAQSERHKTFSERKETGYVTSEAYYRYWDHNIPQGRVLHLWLLDLDSGALTDLFEGTALELPRHAGGHDDYDVHPDGGRVIFAHDPSSTPMLANRTVLTEIDLRTRRTTTRFDDVAWDLANPRYSPDGQQVALLAAHIGQHHTALAEPAVLNADGRWRLLAPGWDHSLNTLRWAADGKAIFFSAEERGRCHLWRLALDHDRPMLAHSGGWVQGFDVAGDTVAVVADSAVNPARVFARHGDGDVRRLESFNDALLADVRFGAVQEVQIRGALDEDVQMWLVFPPGVEPAAEPKKKANKSVPASHPVLQVIHGGPFAAAGDTFSYRWNPHVFAAAGRVVAQVNYHGSSGFGFAFRHSLIGRQGELELQDIEAGTDWLLQQPWADPARVFAAGGSYGGFMVAWMNGHVPAGRYRAYICHAGVFDRISTFSADSWPTRPKDLAAKYWEDMPRVLGQSPHAFAARMHTPTLVIHGAQDFRVPDCNGLAYYNTLKARGVDARLLWFPDENHWVLKPRNSALWYAEFSAWLARHDPALAAQPKKRKKKKIAVRVLE